jgi:hypothetical protein
MADRYLEQLETDPEWINRVADWSNRAAYYVVRELSLVRLLSPDHLCAPTALGPNSHDSWSFSRVMMVTKDRTRARLIVQCSGTDFMG